MSLIYTFIGIAGAIGALLRYGIGLIIPSTSYMGFPVHTLCINLLGCFFLSWFFTWVAEHDYFPNWFIPAIATGFIGSFTTFSTFNIEIIQLVEKNKISFAVTYLFLSMGGGYISCLTGYHLAKKRGK
jgi:CrcB protein